MIRSSVDLPEPLGPSSAVSEPSGISSETSSSATKSPKRFVTSVTGIMRRLLPWLDAGHGEQGRQRDQRQQRGGRVGAREVEVLEALLDEQRERLRLAGDLAGDDADRAELADRARGRQHDAVRDAPADRRQRDRARTSASASAERRRGLLLLVADLAQHRRRPRARRTAARRRSSPAPSPAARRSPGRGEPPPSQPSRP